MSERDVFDFHWHHHTDAARSWGKPPDCGPFAPPCSCRRLGIHQAGHLVVRRKALSSHESPAVRGGGGGSLPRAGPILARDPRRLSIFPSTKEGATHDVCKSMP